MFRPAVRCEPLFLDIGKTQQVTELTACDLHAHVLAFLDESRSCEWVSLNASPPSASDTESGEEESEDAAQLSVAAGPAPSAPAPAPAAAAAAVEKKLIATAPKKATNAKALAPMNKKKVGRELAAAGKSKTAKKKDKKEKKARLLESGKESLYSRAICNR